MTIPRIPSVEKFASFSQIDPAIPTKCIYYLPDLGRNCHLDPSTKDRGDANDLRRLILGSRGTEVSLEALQRYALLNCCRRHHQARLEEFNIVEPLARRWQQELIRTRVSSISLSSEDQLGASQQPSPLPVTSTPPQSKSSVTSRYNLRSRPTTEAPVTTPLVAAHDSQSPNFRPHQTSPTQTVSSVLLSPLKATDKSRGSLYLYTRESSPGFIKIGYTSRSVRTRLAEWQVQCGYIPQLAGTFSDVPNVKRAEKLVHFQLRKEWRREVQCTYCHRQHTEWFEIGIDEAVRIAGQWAEWMRLAEPYDSEGMLDPFWRSHVERLAARGETITAATMLDILHSKNKHTLPAAASHSAVSTVITAALDHAIFAGSMANNNPEQAEETAVSVAQPPATEPASLPKPLETSASVKTIAEAILDLTAKQKDELTFELVRRSSTLDVGAAGRGSTSRLTLERPERHNRSMVVVVCA